MTERVLLCIMDGFGINTNSPKDATKTAKTPNIDKLKENSEYIEINASGEFVGLPDGQMGNSEVGHTNIGAGRIVYQMLVKISKSIEDGDFFQNPALMHSMENAKKNNSALHVMGLLSPGGVHSHMTHLYGIAEMAKKSLEVGGSSHQNTELLINDIINQGQGTATCIHVNGGGIVLFAPQLID